MSPAGAGSVVPQGRPGHQGDGSDGGAQGGQGEKPAGAEDEAEAGRAVPEPWKKSDRQGSGAMVGTGEGGGLMAGAVRKSS